MRDEPGWADKLSIEPFSFRHVEHGDPGQFVGSTTTYSDSFFIKVTRRWTHHGEAFRSVGVTVSRERHKEKDRSELKSTPSLPVRNPADRRLRPQCGEVST